MDTQMLYYWAKFHNMNNIQKRELFSKLIAEQLGIHCEAQIYRVVTRLSFQSLRRKHGELYKLTADEQSFDKLLQELSLSTSTVMNWYHSTLKTNPLKLKKNECAEKSIGCICECCISDEVRERLENNYEFKLVSKRLYQVTVKAELFKQNLVEENIFLSDVELRRSLRRIVEQDYYKDRYKKRTKRCLKEQELTVQKVLSKIGLKAMTVLKWFYLLRHHPELLKKVYSGEINPEEVFVKTGQKMIKEMRGGQYADGNVCN